MEILDALLQFAASAPLMAASGCAFIVSVFLVLTKHRHGHLTMDSEEGVQKFHTQPTPRVGGVGIYLGLLLAWVFVQNPVVRDIIGILLLAGIPALACGLLEDVTKKVGVLPRLLATMVSSVLAWLLTGIALNRLDVDGLDWLLTVTPIAVIFTAIAVSGVANAINIIDGFHGLASGTTIIALLALGAIATRVGDPELARVCFIVSAAVVGFWLVNYPWGKIFLGDGGAYFVGFALAWLAVLLPMRNPGVSAWASMLVCAYPVIEVIYSMARRYIGRQSPGAPDSRHLHSLIKTNLIRKKLPAVNRGVQNAFVSPIIWAFTVLPAMGAVAMFNRSDLLVTAVAGCALVYHLAYRYLALTGVETPALRRPGIRVMEQALPSQDINQ
jgi:UDP-N-acetylmuramyl pentapeptide phosphotransferase/UDP-N-acetylglucosamine-1-phosphate transferase